VADLIVGVTGWVHFRARPHLDASFRRLSTNSSHPDTCTGFTARMWGRSNVCIWKRGLHN